MNISSTSAAPTASPSETAETVNLLVLKKALNAQASATLGLIQALPQPPSTPALATQGSVGTKLNTFA